MSKLPWDMDDKAAEAVDEVKGLLELKHGLFCNIPLICRGSKCPYVKTCIVPEEGRRAGIRCPVEAAVIISRFDQYCEALDVGEDDLVDISLVRDIVDIEVQILRADALMAKDANFIQDVVVGVSDEGVAFTRPEIHKAADMKTNLRKERHRILQLLNSTRKDQQGKSNDPSSMAAALIAKAAALEKQEKLSDRKE